MALPSLSPPGLHAGSEGAVLLFESRAFDRGIDWYRSNFSDADAGAAVAVGEACTNYSKRPRVTGAARRIALVLPDVRLVYLGPRASEPDSFALSARRRTLRGAAPALSRSPRRSRVPGHHSVLHADRAVPLIISTVSDCLWSRRKGCAERARTVSRVLEFVGADPSFSPPPTFPELNRSARRLDTTLSSRLRRLPGYERARRLVPTQVVG